MRILALYPGSNTLRYKVIEFSDYEAGGTALSEGFFDYVEGVKTAEAARQVLARTAHFSVDACAFRVVHGGSYLSAPVLLTSEIMEELRGLYSLAPLHINTDLLVAEAVMQAAPQVLPIAVFDTHFHRTLPEVAYRYALPPYLGIQIRRHGFHGLAHRYVTYQVAGLLGRRDTKIISLHLGGGASACAVRNGESVDTSMGMTPLEGLVMSTRCGDLDPSIVLQLLRTGRSIDDVEELLNKKCGLLGVSGKSGDIRELEPAAADGDADAELALSMFAYRVRKYIGAYAAVLNGLDVIALSGALAENSAGIRRRVMMDLEFLGLSLDSRKNEAARGNERSRLSLDGASVQIWLLPADEEWQMAREAREVVERVRHEP